MFMAMQAKLVMQYETYCLERQLFRLTVPLTTFQKLDYTRTFALAGIN